MAAPQSSAVPVDRPKTPAQAETIAELEKLSIWGKLARGELHKVSKKDVDGLFAELDKDECGEISSDDLMVLMQVPNMSLTQDDIQLLVKDADKNLSGTVCREELWSAFTQGEIAYNWCLQSIGQRKAPSKANECKKEDLLSFLHFEYNRNGALWSLPQTFLLFLAFFISITAHLDIGGSYLMQNSIVQEIEGEGPFWLHKYVHDIPTTWEWLLGSFVNSHFKQDLVNWPHPGRVAAYNQIIGGVKLARVNSVPGTCSQDLKSIYDSRFGGRCFKTGETRSDDQYIFYHDRHEDIVQQLSNLSAAQWLDQNTTKLDIDILFYNAHIQSYSVHKQTFSFAQDGFVKLYFSHETFLAEPYRNILWIVPDIIFLIIILRMFYTEMLELVPAVMAGLDGFYGYLEFWNIIDWLAIIIGVVVSVLWGLHVMVVTQDLPKLVTALQTEPLDYALYETSSYLTPTEFQQIMPRSNLRNKIGELHDTMRMVGEGHSLIRSFVFVYSFVLMMKFFKAFQANPRLNIVIETIKSSAIDIVHFLMVFFVIFIVFSSAAYVCFGNRLISFHTHLRSLMTCWQTLMGEFDMDSMVVVGGQAITYVWMLCFQFLVLLILLNMLLAIIMDTYTAVNQSNSMKIWTQLYEAVRTVKETRGHVDMWYLIVSLEDDDYQAHPEDKVTSKSLRRAFEMKNMTRQNADYLIQKTIAYVKERDLRSDLKLTDALHLISQIKTSVFRNCEVTEELKDMIAGIMDGPQQERYDKIIAGFDPDEQQSSIGGTSIGTPQHRLRQAGRSPMVSQVPSMSRLSLRSANSGGGDLVSSDALQRSESRMSAMISSPGQLRRTQTKDSGTDELQSVNSIMSFRTTGPVNSGGNNGIGIMEEDTDGQVLVQLGQVQSVMDMARNEQFQTQQVLLEEFRDIRQYMEQRDSWLEQRLHAMDRRLEKVEKANDRVCNGMQGVNFEELSATVGSLKSALDRFDGGMRSTVQLHGVPENNSQRADHAHGPTSPGADRRLMEQKLDKMAEQVQQLLSHQEEAAENRRLLWKIDLSLRQLRAGGGVGSQHLDGQASRSTLVSPQGPRPSLGATTNAPPDHRSTRSLGAGTPSRGAPETGSGAVVVGAPVSRPSSQTGGGRTSQRYREI